MQESLELGNSGPTTEVVLLLRWSHCGGPITHKVRFYST